MSDAVGYPEEGISVLRFEPTDDEPPFSVPCHFCGRDRARVIAQWGHQTYEKRRAVCPDCINALVTVSLVGGPLDMLVDGKVSW
jgi:hypothetical protein